MMLKIRKKNPYENVDYQLSNGILLFNFDWCKEKWCYIDKLIGKKYCPIYNLNFELIGFEEKDY